MKAQSWRQRRFGAEDVEDGGPGLLVGDSQRDFSVEAPGPTEAGVNGLETGSGADDQDVVEGSGGRRLGMNAWKKVERKKERKKEGKKERRKEGKKERRKEEKKKR